MNPSVTLNSYAIVPAAGFSRRMGCSKLLLPWPTSFDSGGKLIDHVLNAWTASRVSNVVVVARQDDELLAQACSAWPVELIRPATVPADMKASIQLGLKHLSTTFQPGPNAQCFIGPADLPGLSSAVIDRLIQTPSDDQNIVVPRFGGRPGHPVLLPWCIAQEIFFLGADEGVNCIVDRHPQTIVQFPESMYFSDVDTPEEYRLALQKRIPKSPD